MPKTLPPHLRLHHALVADMKVWVRALRRNVDSQHYRRAFVQSALGYIEAACFGVKQDCALVNDEVIQRGAEPLFTFEEAAMLREVQPRFDKNKVEADYVMPPIAPNVRFAFLSFKRTFGLSWNIPEGDCWNRLQRAKRIRNRIAHPKTPENLNISDDEILEVEEAAAWFGKTHESLIKALTEKVKAVKGGKDAWPRTDPPSPPE
jgi:hypothetical protein